MTISPPLPELEISGLTRKHGLDQQTIDRLLHVIYRDRPDFYTRMAQFEGSGRKEASDMFMKAFREYAREKLGKEADVAKTPIMTSIIWEARRRARLMYGMPI